MTTETRRPTKAAIEFEGDCFGKLYSKIAAECQQCVVRKHCRRQLKSDIEENAVAKKGSKGKKAKAEKPSKKKGKEIPAEETKEVEVKQKPLSKRYKKDKDNFGMRPGSAGWAAFKALTEAIEKKDSFTVDELSRKTSVICKDKEMVKELGGKKKAIEFNADAKIPIMLRIFAANGLIYKTKRGKDGNDEYKKVI